MLEEVRVTLLVGASNHFTEELLVELIYFRSKCKDLSEELKLERLGKFLVFRNLIKFLQVIQLLLVGHDLLVLSAEELAVLLLEVRSDEVFIRLEPRI